MSKEPEQGKGGNTLSRDPNHVAWIEGYLAGVKEGALRGFCHSGAIDMLEAFPELKLVRGHVILAERLPKLAELALEDDQILDPGDGHWWLETAEGEIVDPTAKQFNTDKPLVYVAFDESKKHLLPTGKCMNCGFYAFNKSDFCSDECIEEYSRAVGWK